MLEKSWAGVFRFHLLNHLSVEKLASSFNVDRARPSKDPCAALGALILQQLHDLTDAQVVEQSAFNLSWHYALDIRDDSDVYICKRSLRNNRRSVINQRLDKRAGPARVKKLQLRKYEQSNEFKLICRWRAGIEVTVSRPKHQMNLANLRMRGRNSVCYTVWMR